MADAEVFELRPGDEHAEIDFVTAARDLELPPVAVVRKLQGAVDRSPAAATGISRGRVETTDGRAAPTAQLRLTAGFDLTKSRIGRADANGRYEFSGLVAGKYGLLAVKIGYSPAA